MLIAIWDWLFTRRKWTVIARNKIVDEDGDYVGDRYLFRDQFGNMKSKRF